ncbi:MAG: hypothetical protein VR68_15600 [Peptococcaceae bacterium BRH_c4a]|nr:MAG: hypothetical protein VR68_15600 [Peptococcaceae bacterium BRH_c4a]
MNNKLKDINFLPERILLTRRKRRLSVIYGAAGLLLSAMLGGALWLPVKIAHGYQSSLQGVKLEINKLEPARPYFEEKERLLKEASKKELAIKDIEGRQQKITDILKKINSILPRGCFVTVMGVRAKEEMIIRVMTNDPVETARILVGLRNLGLFKKVELADVTEVPFSTGLREIEFKLVFIGAIENKEKDKEKGGKDAGTEAGKKGDNTAGKIQKLQELVKPGN